MAADKNIDPRFDPAFQRGYADSKQGVQPDAARANRTVDALRDDTAVQYSQPRALPRPSDGAAAGQTSSTVGPGLEEQRSLAPQSHYVDDAGALAEISPAGRGKSLARNPWIYVLWVIGVVALGGGLVGQLWAYTQLYRQSNLPFEAYSLISTVQAVAPSATNLGAICLAAAFVIHAISWMRKNQ